MIQLSELIGHDTLDVSSAVSLGKVTGIGLASNRIVSLGIGGESVDAGAVRGFDGDVVTYEAGSSVPDGSHPLPLDPRGSRVIDLHGDQIGTLADLTISDEGIVDTIVLVGGHALHGSRLRAIGSYAAIVDVEVASS